MPLTRASHATTKRGKQFLQAIEQSRARYEALPERVQPSMNRALTSAARELDLEYQRMSHDQKVELSRRLAPSPGLGMKRKEQ